MSGMYCRFCEFPFDANGNCDCTRWSWESAPCVVCGASSEGGPARMCGDCARRESSLMSDSLRRLQEHEHRIELWDGES